MKKVVFTLIQIILAGTLTLFSQSITSVSISGTPNIGSVLTASFVADTSGGFHYKYEWIRSPSNTVLAEGVTSYSILPSDNGTEIFFNLSILESNNNLSLSMPSSIVTVNSYPVAQYISIAGEPKSNQIIYGIYVYSDADGDIEGSSIYRWYSSDNSSGSSPSLITSGSRTYRVTDTQLGKYIGFSVTPVAQTGSTPGTVLTTPPSWIGPVTNDPPVALSVSLSGGTLVNDVLTGHYTYFDSNGDLEGNSVYEWWRSPDNNIANGAKISGAAGISYKLSLPDTGRYIFFRVTPAAQTGSSPGTRVTSSPSGRINTPPYASAVSVSGTATVGSTLVGEYNYHDGDGNAEGTSLYRWLRDGTIAIPGATSGTYQLTTDDEGYTITFEVTPVSESGYPDTGTPVKSPATAEVIDNTSALPVASEVCIDGERALGKQLTGKYKYTYTRSEGTSTYRWFRNASPISGETGIHYTLTQADLDQDIYFEVTPVSSNHTPRVGDAVKSKSLARITIVQDVFYVSDKDTLLSADPTGGYFWGEGVINGRFSPSSVDPDDSPFKANYHLNTFNCGQDDSKYFTVTDVKMSFESFRDVYCQNGGMDTVYVRSIPTGSLLRSFRLSNPAAFVSQLNDSAIVIDPGRMRAGFKEDTLFFSTLSGTSLLEIYRPFIIDSIAQVTIQNLDTGAVVCNNLTPYVLFVSHPGGIFEGPVNDSIFNPSLALGDASVKYTYTTKRGCVSSVSVPVHINPAPVVNFSVKDNCIESATDSTRFVNLTTCTDSVEIWRWEFYDLGGSSSSDLRNPEYLYKTGGVKDVTLSATTVNNCISVAKKQFDLGVKPLADFYWKNECFHPSDTLLLFDATISPSFIASRSWNFFDGDSLHTLLNPRYPKKQTGYLPIEYIVKTNYLDCHDTVYREVYIRPTISLSDNDYLENFENGKGGWVKDYNMMNTWSFGTPGRQYINSASSGDSAWFTNYDIANQKTDSSSIISPCFDFTSIQRPMISIRLWRRFDLNRDGAALHYRVGDSPGWHNVGTLDDGINWYNSTLIKGKPGNDPTGWTAGAPGNIKDAGWIEAKHKLDELAGLTDVKFRIVYGTDGTSQENDGIAFDDIRIGPRTRGVLLEHFTNNSSAATTFVTSVAENDTTDIINIQYHTNFPVADPYYDDNPGDAGARILFYGLTRSPYTLLDGGTRLAYANSYDHYPVTNLNPNDVVRRSLINPSFLISLNSNVSGGIVSVSGQIKALKDINTSNLTLYLAVTQKVSLGTSGEKYSNVFRKFLPDAAGISLKKNWNENETFDFPEKTWVIEKIPNSADIEIIAFLQNNITKEVYQAESNTEHNISVGIEDLAEGGKNLFSLYPNPASERIVVAFERIPEKETDIIIYDFSGSVIRSYKAGAGTTEYTINSPELKNGIYLVRITAEGLDWGFRKLIISR